LLLTEDSSTRHGNDGQRIAFVFPLSEDVHLKIGVRSQQIFVI
jgi:hypothetical protein